MAQKFLVPIDHNKLESYNFRFQVLAADPGSPVEGQAFYDSVIKSIKFRTDTGWVVTDPSKVTDGYIPLAKVNGAAPLASPTFTGLVTTPAGSSSQAGGLKLTAGTLKTTPVAGDSGAIEYDGTNISFIDSTGARRTLGVSGAGIQTVTLTAPAAGFTITSGGTGQNPTYTFALSDDLAALEGVSTTGIVRRTGTATWTAGGAINLTSEVTGTLPVANGGTGTTSSTGTGSVVLSASPTFTGTPLTTTAAADTNTTQIASTAFVVGQASGITPNALGTAAAGTSLRYARGDHVHAMPTLSQVGAPTADISFNNFKQTNVADPVNDTDGANKRYVDTRIAGLPWKEEVVAATTANVTLSGGAPNTLDGVTLAANDRILVKNQSTASQNGLYIVQTLGTGSNGTWVRSSDADADAELRGLAVFVTGGTANGGIRYVATNTGTIVVGTTAINFAVFDAATSYTAGNGLQLSTNEFSVKLPANSGLVVDGTGLYINTSTVVRKFAQTFGDGSATTYTFTHNLGTLDCNIQVYEVATGDTVITDVRRTSTTQATVTVAVAPASNTLRVVIQA